MSRRRGHDSAPRPLPDRVETAAGTVTFARARDESSLVTVLIDGVPSSELDLQDPARLTFEYMQQMATVIDWRYPPGAPLRILHVGGAGCALPRALAARRPGSRQIVAEVDETIATGVREWFDLPRAPQLKIRPLDGRALLETRAPGSADVVIRDAFAPDHVPSHLTTTEFFRAAARALTQEGLLLSNHEGSIGDAAAAARLRGELAASQLEFGSLALILEPGYRRGRRRANVVSVACRAAGAFDGGRADALARALRALPMPVRWVSGEDADRFIGQARPLHDPVVADGGDEARGEEASGPKA